MEPLLLPQPRAVGMGIPALVLGVVGVAVGMLVFLFWVSWLPSLLAVVFGCVGLSRARKGLATDKGMALAGVVLGGCGLLIAIGSGVFTGFVVKAMVDDKREQVEEVRASAEAQRKTSEAEEKARHLSFGASYAFGDGLKVTVAKPEPFDPDSFATGHEKGNKAFQVTITVANTGTERFELDPGLPRVNDADGATTELVIDGSGRQKIISGYVLPGRQVVGKYAYSLPPDAAGTMEVEFSPDEEQWERSYWSGPTP
ncbi:DUF4190 domain-containing protein [Streptomyces sp. CB02923]|uniref:DUF4190 domain-containing protein n=1 Tax=Streptomyces sp. CB02923 TaxID=1718985 RepID=UPI001901DDF6|nr:DUF4190 domain-containing protein [Streptomyces sp. CB02923]